MLAAAAKKTGFDVILCGDGSADLYAQQVGLLLGEALGVVAINGVSRILSLSETSIQIERTLEDEVETLTIRYLRCSRCPLTSIRLKFHR